MRWPDELWVKLYTRDTPEWLALSWQARGLFALLTRAVDKAGILSVGSKLKIKGVAVSLRAPWSEIEAPLQELLDDGCVVYDDSGGKLLIPNFIEAQTATMSDAARKRKSREEARAGVNRSSRFVTDGHEVRAVVTDRSKNVTNGHAGERIVTKGHENSGPLLSSPLISSPLLSSVLPVGVQGEAAARAEAIPTKRKVGHRLSEDWEPKQSMVDDFATRGFDALASLKRFKNHWLSATGKGSTKLDWDRTFENWVDADIERGVAKKIASTPSAAPTDATPAFGSKGRMVHMGKTFDLATGKQIDPLTNKVIDG